MDIETTGPEASTDSEYVALEDAANPTEAINEELYELIAGKNADGTPLKKSFNKDEMLKLAQKGFGADATFEEAKREKAQMRELARMLADPEAAFEVLKKFGHDPDQLMTGRMAKQMLEAMKSPQEIEAEGWKKDAEEFRAWKAKQQKDEEEQQITTRATQIRDSLYTRIEETLNSAGVKKTKSTVAEVGRYIKQMAAKADADGKPFDIETVKLNNIVQHLKGQYKQTFDSLLEELDEDGILSTFSEAQLKKIGAALTKKLSSGNVRDIHSIKREATAPAVEKADKRERALSTDEANEIAAERTRKLQALWEKQNGR